MIPYAPEPFVNFSVKENLEAFNAALDKVQVQLGQSYPLVIGGEAIMRDRLQDSVNPSDLNEIVGRVSMADTALVEKAFAVAAATFESWSKVPAEVRAGYLFKAAAIIRRRKHEFSSWLLVEAGKSRAEADADTAECIDFLEYYGRQMLKLKERSGAGKRSWRCLVKTITWITSHSALGLSFRPGTSHLPLWAV